VVSSALIECEEALNQGSMTAAEVFISLRSKSILHLFASIGRVLGLEVYLPVFSPLDCLQAYYLGFRITLKSKTYGSLGILAGL